MNIDHNKKLYRKIDNISKKQSDEPKLIKSKPLVSGKSKAASEIW